MRGEGNVFRRLPEIEELLRQDPVDIIIENEDGGFLYRVVRTTIVHQDDLALYGSDGTGITLVACVPTRVYDHRLLVTAELIAGKMTKRGRILRVVLKKVVWTYNSATMNGNKGKHVDVHAFARLSNGNTMITESGVGRIIEVDKDGKLVGVIIAEFKHTDLGIVVAIERVQTLLEQVGL